MRQALLLCALVACGRAETTAPTGAPSAGPSDGSAFVATAPRAPTVVHVDDDATFAKVSEKLLVGQCADAMLVWGEVHVDVDVGKPVRLEVGSRPALEGFLVCQFNAEAFLKAQTQNPRIKAGRSGTADVRLRDGQLVMHRRWSAGEVPLGDLSTVPPDVFQTGESLAALLEADEKTRASVLVPMMANLPKAFVFAMWPLR
jgi:hypothetical protein